MSLSYIQHTLDEATQAVLKAMASHDPKAVRKGLSVAGDVNLIGINLEAPAKQLVPLMSPFRQSIPRVTNPGSDSTSWRAITALSMPKGTTTESAAANLFTTTTVPRSVTYKHIGLRGRVTRAMVAATEGFNPALAKETSNTLLNAMRIEDMYLLGGNVTALATPGAPTVTEIEALPGATIGAGSFFVRIAALTVPAANRVTIDYPADFDGTNATLDGRAVASADPSSDGVTVVGAEGTVTTTGTGNSLKITWTPVNGAAAYAVFVGTTTGAANLKCECIVTQCNITLRSLNGTGQAGSALVGTSADASAYDGLIAQLFAGGSGAYIKNLGAKLSGSAAQGELLELQDAFASIWSATKINKFRILVGGQDQRILTRLGVVSQAMHLTINTTDAGRSGFTAGASLGQVVNSIGGYTCPVETHPWLPGGMILIIPVEIPYNDANVNAPLDVVCGYDWERFDYSPAASTGPLFEFDTRYWGALRVLLTGGCGVIHNILKG